MNHRTPSPRGPRRLLLATLLLPAAAVAQPCSPSWSTAFPAGDFDGNIRAVAVYNDGSGPTLFAAGGFTRAGGVPAKGVARWTGSTWAPVGGDFDAEVSALVVHTNSTGTFLYAAGFFRTINGVPVRGIARWTGSAWAAVGGGLYGYPRGMTSYTDQSGTYLVVVGDGLNSQIPVGGGPVAKWNGTSWSIDTALSSSMRLTTAATINTLQGQQLYVGGRSVTPSLSGNIAVWASNHWDPVGPSGAQGVDGPVYTMTAHTDHLGASLFVGGDFLNAGGQPSPRIARWNGTAWSGFGPGADRPVLVLASVDADGPFGSPPFLYAGGEFNSIGGAAAKFLARWDGGSWAALPSQPNDVVYAIVGRLWPDPALFAAGAFSAVGGTPASRIASYTPGSGWSALGNTSQGSAPSEQVRDIEPFDPDGAGPIPPKLYIAGDFNAVGALTARHIAAWDNAAWSVPGSGSDGPINVLKAVDGRSGPQLLAGGSFTTIDGVAAAGIAAYDGQSWSPVGGGLFGTVHAIEAFGSPPSIYAGGRFSLSSGGSLIYLARWDGTQWHAVNADIGSQVASLAVYDDGTGPALYVGGDIYISSAGFSDGILRWNGAAWSAVGDPPWFVSPSITSLAVAPGPGGPALYAAGLFQTSSPFQTGMVARWSGSAWTMLPPDTTLFTPVALAAHDDGSGPALYATGGFSAIGSVPAARVARWNGSAWAGLGAGLGGLEGSSSAAIASFDPDGAGPSPAALFVGGRFTSAGGHDSGRLARWGCAACYANCDGSTAAPILNVSDFICFLNRFNAGDPYANCDGSTAPPVLNVADFICFQSSYAAGCP